jgi:hypothetical protein
MSESHSELQISLKDRLTGRELLMSALDEIPLIFESTESLINRYSLVFRSGGLSTGETGSNGGRFSDVEVYPNPASDYLNVRIFTRTKEPTYHIYTLIGSCVGSGQLGESGIIDIRNLGPGLYFLTLFDKKVLFRVD